MNDGSYVNCWCADCTHYAPAIGGRGWCSLHQTYYDWNSTACSDLIKKGPPPAYKLKNGKFGAYITVDGRSMPLEEIVLALNTYNNEWQPKEAEE